MNENVGNNVSHGTFRHWLKYTDKAEESYYNYRSNYAGIYNWLHHGEWHVYVALIKFKSDRNSWQESQDSV